MTCSLSGNTWLIQKIYFNGTKQSTLMYVGCFLRMSQTFRIFALWITVMNKEHCIIENLKALKDYGCEIDSNLKDGYNERPVVHEITYPYYLMN